MKIEAILFDIDGTLVENIDSIKSSYLKAFSIIQEEFSLPKFSDSKLLELLGLNLKEVVNELGFEEIVIPRIKEEYIFDQRRVTHKLKEGAIELIHLTQEKNIPIAIVTSKMRETTQDLMNLLNLNDYFPIIITGDDVSKKKPDPEPIRQALEKLSLKPSDHIYYIGDSLTDIICAREASIIPIGVTWGLEGENICDQVDLCVTSFYHLKDLLFSDP